MDLMKYIIATLKGVIQVKLLDLPLMRKLFTMDKSILAKRNMSAFSAIVRKEFTDYIKSWRIIILLIIIALTCIGSLYTAISTIQDVLSESDDAAKEIVKDSYLFLKLFTVSDGTLPPFITFVTFL